MNERNRNFRIMTILVIVFGLLMLLGVVASAQSYYHELIINLDGDYDLSTNVVLPDANIGIDLDGVGKAYIKSIFIFVQEDMDELKDWWNLF